MPQTRVTIRPAGGGPVGRMEIALAFHRVYDASKLDRVCFTG
ncbi:MAG: hypothetical protein NUV77_11995 [Thermoguttaceae bacterium]|nr:hypothetical protein [Thermoguttaceae bacterium]